MKDYEELWNEKVKEVGRVKEKNTKVLDCGCGYGRLMKYFKNIWGLDCSIEMLKKNPYYPGRAIHHDLTKRFSFPDNFFDYSFASLVLQHLPTYDAAKIIKEMNRVTKKKIMFNLPSTKEECEQSSTLFMSKTKGYLIINRYYTTKGVEKLLEKSKIT